MPLNDSLQKSDIEGLIIVLPVGFLRLRQCGVFISWTLNLTCGTNILLIRSLNHRGF